MSLRDAITSLPNSPFFQAIYYRLPVGLQSLAAGVVGGAFRKERFGPEFHDEMQQIFRRMAMSRDEWQSQQIETLRRTLAHAREHVPAYRDKFRDVGPEDIHSLADWEKLPITGRNEVRENPKAFYADDVDKKDVVYSSSSGSTMSALKVRWERGGMQRIFAAFFYARYRAGYTIESSNASFIGRRVIAVKRTKPPFWVHNRANRQWIFSCYHCRPEMLAEMCKQLATLEVDFYQGFPSFIYLVAAQYLKMHLPPPSIRHVFTSSESLTETQRDVIERAFDCKVVEHYGAAEGAGILAQCSEDDHRLALIQGHCFLRPGDLSKAPDQGTMIGTNTINRAMPLVNYVIGDLATRADDPQWHVPLLGSIDGRLDDYIVDRNGTRYGRLSHVFKYLFAVREAQFVQQREGEVEIRVVPGPDFADEDMNKIHENCRQYLGDMDVRVVLVKDIPRTKSGKLRAVINTMPEHRVRPAD